MYVSEGGFSVIPTFEVESNPVTYISKGKGRGEGP